MNTFMTVQGFYRHAKRHKGEDFAWSCVKCNDAEAFPTVCRALSHFSTAAATGMLWFMGFAYHQYGNNFI